MNSTQRSKTGKTNAQPGASTKKGSGNGSVTAMPTPPAHPVSPFSPPALLKISEDHKRQLREAFDQFDTEGVGRIHAHEVKVAMYALGYDVSNPELHQLLREVGANPNEQIDFNDFYNVLVHKMTVPEARIESTRAFKLLDEDNKGYIGVEDLREIANSLQMDLTDDELVEMILFAHPLSDASAAAVGGGGANMTEFDAKEALVVREDDFLKLMKRANVYK